MESRHVLGPVLDPRDEQMVRLASTVVLEHERGGLGKQEGKTREMF